MNEAPKNTLKNDLALFGNLRVMTSAAFLAALSLILGKFLQIPNPFQEFIRISFENLPVIFAGICFGPAVGAVTGAVADLVGCLLYGYTVNPLITLGAAVVGLAAGIVSHYLVRRPLWLMTALSVLAAHLAGSVAVKTFGLAAWYLTKYSMGLAELMLWRLLTYTIIGIAEFLLIYILLRQRAVMAMIDRFRTKKSER